MIATAPMPAPGDYSDAEILAAVVTRSPQRQTRQFALTLAFPGGAQGTLPLWLTRGAARFTRCVLARIAPGVEPGAILAKPSLLVGRTVAAVEVTRDPGRGGGAYVNVKVARWMGEPPPPPPPDADELDGLARDLGW